VSSLDTFQSLIFNTKELTGDPLEFNIQLLYGPLSNIYMAYKLTGHPPQFNIQLQWAYRRPFGVQYSTPIWSVRGFRALRNSRLCLRLSPDSVSDSGLRFLTLVRTSCLPLDL
jgi:hypothetical protein